MADAPAFTREELVALERDATFQKRVSGDETLNRLFSPPADDPREREDSFRALGAGCVIAGVPLPPPTLGTMRLLSAVDSEFVKSERKFADIAREVSVALFVLHYGSRAVAPVCQQFRYKAALERYRPHADKSPDMLAKCAAIERDLAGELAAWDCAINRFSERVRLQRETLVDVAAQIDAYIMAALSGLDMLPQVGGSPDPTKARADGTPRASHNSSPLFGRLRRALRWRPAAGRSR